LLGGDGEERRGGGSPIFLLSESHVRLS
jgi:hypothetical protein